MKRMWVPIAIVALAAAASCNGGDDAVDDARARAILAEMEEHSTHVEALTSVAGVPAEEERHHDAITHEMNGMHGDLEHMQSECHDGMEHMQGWLDAAEAECADHEPAMLGCTDLTCAHEEEVRHQARMHELLEDMDAMDQDVLEGCGHHM